MRKLRGILWAVTMISGFLLAGVLSAAEIVVYGFEGTLEGWVIPDWAKTSSDYVAKALTVSNHQAQEGQYALELQAEFPGDRWTGVYVERPTDVTDWTPFSRLSTSFYLPPDAPAGLAGRIILTVGADWKWTEMNRAVPLVPGTWTTVTVHLKPGSMDWKFFPDDEFRKLVRKIGVRVESNQTAYSGPVLIDNVRLAE